MQFTVQLICHLRNDASAIYILGDFIVRRSYSNIVLLNNVYVPMKTEVTPNNGYSIFVETRRAPVWKNNKRNYSL